MAAKTSTRRRSPLPLGEQQDRPYNMHLLIKTLIAAVSETAKRTTWFGAIDASLPITSSLAMLRLYYETRDPQRVARLPYGIFLMALPSLGFFLTLTYLLKHLPFAAVMPIALIAMVGANLLYSLLLARLGIQI